MPGQPLFPDSRASGGVAPDWDALAPYWHHFEHRGLNRAVLATLGKMPAPTLLVGGGRGSLARYLQARHLDPGAVVAVDSSAEMARYASERGGPRYVVADVRRLPLPNRAFRSVVCATGVVEFLSPADCATAVGEMSRVCTLGGVIWVAAFSAGPRQAEAPQRPSGACEAPRPMRADIITRWYESCESLTDDERRSVAAFSAVAEQMGDRAKAYELLRACLPRLDGMADFAGFSRLAADTGCEVRSSRYLAERALAIWELSPASD
ncbi:MAG TPA: class I SAM-dependent methyltransferase [Kofleriaceae bacterium]|nr:class I SAM-dependent methyltransferase [Kofleriaceae bacterium]